MVLSLNNVLPVTNIKEKWGLDGITPLTGNAGHRGNVTKCKLKGTNELFAVKHYNYQGLDYHREIEFYKDSKNFGWNWAPRMYDDFSYEDGTYTVVDWIEGETLTELFKTKLTQSTSVTSRLKLVTKILKEYNQIMNDLLNKGKIIYDLHKSNVMVKNSDEIWYSKPVLKVIDGGEYQDLRDCDGQKWANWYFITLLEAAFPKETLRIMDLYYKSLKKLGKTDTEIKLNRRKNFYSTAYVYQCLTKILSALNAEIRFDKQCFYIERHLKKDFIYTSDQRDEAIKQLEDTIEKLKPPKKLPQ